MQPKEIIIISGRSGAGKSTVARLLEDKGFFVVDNLPAALLENLLSMTLRPEKTERLALIIDVREPTSLPLLPKKWAEINRLGIKTSLIFLDASDSRLIDRFKETRRRHPLEDNDIGIRQALAHEAVLLEPIREIATKLIMSDNLSVHELKALISEEIALSKAELGMSLMSFGYKYGMPYELDLCFDVRFLQNPYYEPTLRALNGCNKDVADFVFAQAPAHEFLAKTEDLLTFLYPHYCQEGKVALTVALGCTGGQHRSVALVEDLAKRLKEKINIVRVEHRDLARHS
jgi:UPF0042 nucleotide-binding protein